jgi:hypothetical protein
VNAIAMADQILTIVATAQAPTPDAVPLENKDALTSFINDLDHVRSLVTPLQPSFPIFQF